MSLEIDGDGVSETGTAQADGNEMVAGLSGGTVEAAEESPVLEMQELLVELQKEFETLLEQEKAEEQLDELLIQQVEHTG